jgi:hypothetical protein
MYWKKRGRGPKILKEYRLPEQRLGWCSSQILSKQMSSKGILAKKGGLMKAHSANFILLMAALTITGQALSQANRAPHPADAYGYYTDFYVDAYNRSPPSRHQGPRHQAPPVVRHRPPIPVPPMAYRMGPPSPRHVWMHGDYMWRKGRYVYMPGRWVIPPRRGHQYIAGYWQPTRGGFIWVSGFWTNGRQQRW